MKHTGKRHQLSISGGWSGYGGADGPLAIEVWCGYCKAIFEADQEWAERYLAASERRLRRRLDQPGLYGISQAQFDLIMADDRAQMARAGLL
jgi:hypothetical protein